MNIKDVTLSIAFVLGIAASAFNCGVPSIGLWNIYMTSVAMLALKAASV